MNNADALRAVREYYDITNPTEDDEFMYTEALGYLIEETKDPRYMCDLAWFYCSKKRFDIEIRYLEMAAEYGSLNAMEELGYMWYYGQHGEKDYDKAFYYFSKGAEGDDGDGSLWSKYKLADIEYLIICLDCFVHTKRIVHRILQLKRIQSVKRKYKKIRE